jgi:hypothetical protein
MGRDAMDISENPVPDKPSSAVRERLPNRRRCETTVFFHEGSSFTVSFGFFPDGRLGEIFLNHSHSDSLLDAVTSDGAIAVSIALQLGADLETFKHATKRNSQGVAASPIGHALELVPWSE